MRIVVKIGTSTLAHPGGRLNIRHTEALVKVWSDIKNAGHELIIVSSGATGLGVGKLQISRPKDMVTKQAAAAVGQCELMYTYDKLFAEYSHTVAQLLVTWEDFDHPHRLNNLQNTLERLIQLGAVPVINENDPISTEEYSLGDNDRLGALIAKYTHADLLGLLSLAPVVLAFLIMATMTGKRMVEKMRQYGNALEAMSNEAVEYVRGIPVVKTFGQSVFSFKKM